MSQFLPWNEPDPSLLALDKDGETVLQTHAFSYWLDGKEYTVEFPAADAESARRHARALARNRVYRGIVVAEGNLSLDTPPPSSHVRVDFNKLYSHPLAQGFYDLTQQIERLGTSPEMTSVIVAVQSVKTQVEAEINHLLQNAASDGALLTRYHRWCEKNGCAPSTSDLYGDGANPAPQPRAAGTEDKPK